MTPTRLLRLSLLCLMLCAIAAQPAFALNDYGKVKFVAGDVKVYVGQGSFYVPKVGDTLRENDLLITGVDGEMHVTTLDDGLIALRPNTRVRVQEYRAEGGTEDRSVLELLRGRVRSITGWIALNRAANYQIRTVTATIGVRGTDHETAYIPVPAAGEVTEGRPGTYDKVNEGETFIESTSGRVAVLPNQSGFAPLDAAAPVILRAIPEFYRVTQYEQLIESEREKLMQKLLERPRQIQQQMEDLSHQPQREAEQRMQQEFRKWTPRW